MTSKCLLFFLLTTCLWGCDLANSDRSGGDKAPSPSNALKDYIKNPKDAANEVSDAATVKRHELEDVADEVDD